MDLLNLDFKLGSARWYLHSNEGEYKKWNNNFGKVAHDLNVEDFTKVSASCGVELNSLAFLLGRKERSSHASKTAAVTDKTGLGKGKVTTDEEKLDTIKHNAFNFLGVIDEEGSDDEEYSDEDNYSFNDNAGENISKNIEKQDDFDELIATAADLLPPKESYRSIPNGDFAQAFSHFSYVRSGGKIMVVDLQGSLEINKEENTCKFVLTDPAIHKRRKLFKHKPHLQSLFNFGRTDRRDEGINAFLESHVCNDACRLLGLRPHQEFIKNMKK